MYRHSTKIWTFIGLLWFIQPLFAINPPKGIPFLYSYYPQDYHNAGKIWDIKTAPNGLVYLASDKGLLEFDGKKFRFFKGSKGVIRSLIVINDSTLLSGSDLDFGIWKKGGQNQLIYQSLYPFSSETFQINEEFWQIQPFGSDYLFISSTSIYLFKKNQITKISAPVRLKTSFVKNKTLYFENIQNQLLELQDFNLRTSTQSFPLTNIIGYYNTLENNWLISTDAIILENKDGGRIELKNEIRDLMDKNQLFCHELINDQLMAIGTVSNGLFISNLKGELILHLNKSKGLANNTVLKLHYNHLNQLWISTDYGLAFINLNDPISYIFDHKGSFGTAYSALLTNETLLLGTNQGLYSVNWNELSAANEIQNFKLLANSSGQVWKIAKIQDDVLVAHNKGLFELKNNRLEMISAHDGVFDLLPYDNYLLSADYNGMSVYEKRSNNWWRKSKIDGIYGACKQILLDQKRQIWLSIPNFGFIRLSLNKDFSIKEKRIYPEAHFTGNTLQLRHHAKDVFIESNQTCYKYDAKLDSFIRLENPVFYTHIQALNHFAHPEMLTDSLLFIPLNNGFALKTNHQIWPKLKASKPQLVIQSLRAFNNEVTDSSFTQFVFPNTFNNIRVEFIIPNTEQVSYRYKRSEKGEWSNWVSNNELTLVSLKPGRHELYIQGKSTLGLSEIKLVTFKILKPWYKQTSMLLLYLLLAFLLTFGIRQYIRKRNKAILTRMQEIRSRHVSEENNRKEVSAHLVESEALRQENSDLKEKIQLQAKQLNKLSREIEAKERMLEGIKDTLSKPLEAEGLNRELKNILKDYSQTEYKSTTQQLDEIHHEFYKRLKHKYPELSINDLRYCAYLIQGLNSKEIAEILHIQPSSSYISRSRLRKKMGLSSDQHLFDVLMEYK